MDLLNRTALALRSERVRRLSVELISRRRSCSGSKTPPSASGTGTITLESIRKTRRAASTGRSEADQVISVSFGYHARAESYPMYLWPERGASPSHALRRNGDHVKSGTDNLFMRTTTSRAFSAAYVGLASATSTFTARMERMGTDCTSMLPRPRDYIGRVVVERSCKFKFQRGHDSLQFRRALQQ